MHVPHVRYRREREIDEPKRAPQERREDANQFPNLPSFAHEKGIPIREAVPSEAKEHESANPNKMRLVAIGVYVAQPSTYHQPGRAQIER